MTMLKNFVREDRGQDLVEYTLLIVAAAFTGLALVSILKPALSSQWVSTGDAIGTVSAAVAS